MQSKDRKVDFIWDEDTILNSCLEYIESTYSAHYKGDTKQGIQFTEYFASKNTNEASLAAFKFNAAKYIDRFGRKDGFNEKDIYKAIHYCVMMLSLLSDKETV